jgi:DNA-binding transcriptional ArsR family regulator
MTFSALADPTRRAILARLVLGETSVSELAKPFDISGPAISKHLKVLEQAGLITRGREAQWRPCKIEPQALRGVDEWLEHYRRLWEERLDRLDDYLKALQAKQSTEEPEKKRGRKK